MIKTISKIILLIILIFVESFPQQQGEIITVVGKKMTGKMVDGETIREVTGDVVITQGDVKITCDKTIHYISRNNAELIGNVVVKQDSVTIYTDHGFYYGDEKKAESTSGVKLDDKKVILTAKVGEYYFDEDKAFFKDSVQLFDTTSTLTANKLTYFQKEDRAIAVGDVKIEDGEDLIYADSLEHFRNDRITFAFNNVKITSTKNNTEIYGDHLEDFANKFYTLIDKNPLMIQVDTSYVMIADTVEGSTDSIAVQKLDSLIIKSEKMESFRDTLNIFKAEDSVKIVRADFASVNDKTTYLRNDDKIITQKIGSHGNQPVLWFGSSQLTGDSVTIFLKKNEINKLDVDGAAFILSQNEDYPERFDQISGDKIILSFENSAINKTEIFGNTLSIYYLYDNGKPNGLNKSSSKNAVINFKDKRISTIQLYKSVEAEYYPENKVKGKELSFTLPRYVYYKNRPTREGLIYNLKR